MKKPIAQRQSADFLMNNEDDKTRARRAKCRTEPFWSGPILTDSLLAVTNACSHFTLLSSNFAAALASTATCHKFSSTISGHHKVYDTVICCIVQTRNRDTPALAQSSGLVLYPQNSKKRKYEFTHNHENALQPYLYKHVKPDSRPAPTHFFYALTALPDNSRDSSTSS